MSPKRGGRVAFPAGAREWEVRFGNTTAAKGWENPCQQAPGNTREAWHQMRTNPAPAPPTPRHHQLKGTLAFAEHGSKQLACWHIEVTGGGRIWYLLDPDRRTVWITEAGTARPKKPTRSV
ncbi:MAG TPA: hypothetical protein VF788_05670 [Pseudonocardiaceae bacterium]